MTTSYIFYWFWPIILPFIVMVLLAKFLAIVVFVVSLLCRWTYLIIRWTVKESWWLVLTAHRELVTRGR